MHGCHRQKEIQEATQLLPKAVDPLPNMDSLRTKRKSKQTRLRNTRAKTDYLYYQSPSKCGSQLLPVGERHKRESIEGSLHAIAKPSRFEIQVIEFPGFIRVSAALIRGLFPAGMMVAALIFLLNVVILINLPAPDIKGSLDGFPICLVVITPLIYLIVGTVSRLTISKQDFTFRLSIAVSAIPTIPSGRICRGDIQQ